MAFGDTDMVATRLFSAYPHYILFPLSFCIVLKVMCFVLAPTKLEDIYNPSVVVDVKTNKETKLFFNFCHPLHYVVLLSFVLLFRLMQLWLMVARLIVVYGKNLVLMDTWVVL